MSYRRKSFRRRVIAQYNNQQLKGELTLAAGTYNEEEVLMPQCPMGILPGLLELKVQWDAIGVAGNYFDAAGDYAGVHLSPKSQDDLIQQGDPDCICSKQISNHVVTVQGVMANELIYNFPAPQLISYKQIWFGAKSTFALNLSYCISWCPRVTRVPQRDNTLSQAQF